jgi:hypothetical protein
MVSPHAFMDTFVGAYQMVCICGPMESNVVPSCLQQPVSLPFMHDRMRNSLFVQLAAHVMPKHVDRGVMDPSFLEKGFVFEINDSVLVP